MAWACHPKRRDPSCLPGAQVEGKKRPLPRVRLYVLRGRGYRISLDQHPSANVYIKFQGAKYAAMGRTFVWALRYGGDGCIRWLLLQQGEALPLVRIARPAEEKVGCACM